VLKQNVFSGGLFQEMTMPRYDYRCVECEHQFELRQSFSEAGKGTCPECSGVGQRVYHAVPVIYKGSGFYTTDYGRPKPPVENGASKNGSDSAKSDSDGKPAESTTSDSGSSSSSSESASPAASTASSS
jgi:putative FmdB family regulatory protein